MTLGCYEGKLGAEIQLYNPLPPCNPLRPMLKMKRFLPLLLLPWLFYGCANSIITNLTPTQLPRNTNGAYLVEMALDTSDATLRPKTVTPAVVVGFDSYPMRRTLRMNNRWETLVPVPAGKDSIDYHFKVEYEYDRFGKPGKGSLRSTEYKLTITK